MADVGYIMKFNNLINRSCSKSASEDEEAALEDCVVLDSKDDFPRIMLVT